MRLAQPRARIAALSCVALLAAAPAARSQLPYGDGASGLHAAPAELPGGLALVWRLNGRKLGRDDISAGSLNAFSPDGRYVGVYEATRVRIVDSRTGTVVRTIPQDASNFPVFAFAISPQGQAAVGRSGGVEVFGAGPGNASVRYPYLGSCGVLTAVAFSADGALLAYQGVQGLTERREGRGSVGVIDMRTGAPLGRAEATAGLAQVAFSRDGRRLTAMHATQIADTEAFGIRVWDTKGLRLTRSFYGGRRMPRTVGALAGAQHAAVYQNQGRLEVRDLANDRLLWSAALIAPKLGALVGMQRKMNLDLVEIAPDGRFLVTYEAPVDYDPTGRLVGTLCVRNGANGAVIAMYDVARVSDLAIAPDGKTFVYTTGSGQTYTAVARVPF